MDPSQVSTWEAWLLALESPFWCSFVSLGKELHMNVAVRFDSQQLDLDVQQWVSE